MTEAIVHHHQDLSVDLPVAPRTTAARLAREFDGTYGAETIERFLRTSPTTTFTRRVSISSSRSNGR